MDTIAAFLTEYLKNNPNDIDTVNRMIAALTADKTVQSNSSGADIIPPSAESYITLLYSKGADNAAVKSAVDSRFGISASLSAVASVINRAQAAAADFRSHPLCDLYVLIYPYTMVYHVKSGSALRKVPVHFVIGLSVNGRREVLGLYTAENISDWLAVFDDIKSRCTSNVLAACCDSAAKNTGFNAACADAFPNADVYGSVMHLSADTIKTVRYKDLNPVKASLKQLHTAADENVARMELDLLADKWEEKYPGISKPWYNNWCDIAPIFELPQALRRIFYTYNTLDVLSAGMRKCVDMTTAFENEEKMLVMLSLAAVEATKKWKKQRQDWADIRRDIDRVYAGRM